MQPVNPLEHPDWDAALARRPDFSFFHGAAWTAVLAETYGFRSAWQQEGTSYLPMMEVNSWLTGRRGIGLPFTDDCAPLCDSEAQFKILFERAAAWGRARGWKYLELRGGRTLAGGAPAWVSFYGHEIDLAVGEERLFAGMDGSVRQGIRKAERDGVTAEVLQSEAAMREFYHLQCLTRKRHGLPPQPARFFMNIWRRVVSRNQGVIVLARWQGEVVAGAVYFFLGGRAIYKFGASDYRRQQLRPNNLVMWAGMKWLARAGYGRLHLGKTSLLHDGLRKFKRNLGAVEERIEYVRFNLRRDQFEIGTDEVAGWHNAVFHRLPLWLSRGAGQLLYKHWA